VHIPEFVVAIRAQDAKAFAALVQEFPEGHRTRRRECKFAGQIALSNTTYTYNRHPDWAGSPPPVTTIPVMSLDIVELIAGGGCNPLSKKLHALFTAYHPYLATLNLFLEGPAPLPATINPAISANGEADSPGGGQLIDISGLKPCAYILWGSPPH